MGWSRRNRFQKRSKHFSAYCVCFGFERFFVDLSARPSPASAAQMQDDWSRCCFCHFSFHKSSRSVGVQQNYWTGRNNKAESLLEVPLSTSCSIPWNPVLVLIAPAKEQVQNATNQFGPKEASTPPPHPCAGHSHGIHSKWFVPGRGRQPRHWSACEAVLNR